jgi:hypothetical protein
MSVREFVLNLAAGLMGLVLFAALLTAVTDQTYQAGLTNRWNALQQTERERERTRQIQAEEWNATLRTYGAWGGGVLVVAVVAAAGGYTVVQWQRERTRRAVHAETQATQRALIGAQRDVMLRWLELHGTPGAYLGKLGGTPGVFLPESGEFVTAARCQVELRQHHLLERGD